MSIFTHKLKLELAELKHKHEMELEASKARFERAQIDWDKDKKRLESDLRKDSDIKLLEAVTLAKLSAEQQTKQQELNFKREVEDLKTKNATEMAEYKTKIVEEYHAKLSEALNKLHTEGNITTKFTQELALKMLDKAPPTTNRIELLKGEIKE